MSNDFAGYSGIVRASCEPTLTQLANPAQIARLPIPVGAIRH